jgi:hypothetical protein
VGPAPPQHVALGCNAIAPFGAGYKGRKDARPFLPVDGDAWELAELEVGEPGAMGPSDDFRPVNLHERTGPWAGHRAVHIVRHDPAKFPSGFENAVSQTLDSQKVVGIPIEDALSIDRWSCSRSSEYGWPFLSFFYGDGQASERIVRVVAQLIGSAKSYRADGPSQGRSHLTGSNAPESCVDPFFNDRYIAARPLDRRASSTDAQTPSPRSKAGEGALAPLDSVPGIGRAAFLDLGDE